MLIIHYVIFFFIFLFSSVHVSFCNAKETKDFVNFSKITIKVEDEKKIETIIAYNKILHLTPKIAKLIGLRVKYRNQLKLEDNKLNLWRTISANTRREQDFYNKLGD